MLHMRSIAQRPRSLLLSVTISVDMLPESSARGITLLVLRPVRWLHYPRRYPRHPSVGRLLVSTQGLQGRSLQSRSRSSRSSPNRLRTVAPQKLNNIGLKPCKPLPGKAAAEVLDQHLQLAELALALLPGRRSEDNSGWARTGTLCIIVL